MPTSRGTGQYLLAYKGHAISIDWDNNLIFDCSFKFAIHFLEISILKNLFGQKYNYKEAYYLRRIVIPNREYFLYKTNVCYDDYRKKEYNLIINKINNIIIIKTYYYTIYTYNLFKISYNIYL
jgi:hypothetical protein